MDKEEQQLWHPRNYEILSGHITAPGTKQSSHIDEKKIQKFSNIFISLNLGLPEFAESELMKSKLNTYGKTIQVLWKDGIPQGDAHVAWAFTKDGQIRVKFVLKNFFR